MTEVIHDGETFMRRFRIGETFWTFSSYNGEPKGITESVLEGYCRVKDLPGYEHLESVEIIVLCGPYGHTHLLDLTNEYHGVCESLTDAETEFDRRRKAWEPSQRRTLISWSPA